MGGGRSFKGWEKGAHSEGGRRALIQRVGGGRSLRGWEEGA